MRPCPLWVISRHKRQPLRESATPNSGHKTLEAGMSALMQKRKLLRLLTSDVVLELLNDELLITDDALD
jgi:hypothetical protein